MKVIKGILIGLGILTLLIVTAVIVMSFIFIGNDSDSTEGQKLLNHAKATPESLEKALNKQEVVIEDARFIVQDAEYKSLYPDLIQTIVQNNSSEDIKRIVIGAVAWDENGLPIALPLQYSFGHSGTFDGVKDEEANIVAGGTYGSDVGMELDEDHHLHAFKTIIVEYEDYNGNVWNNPELNTFKSIYQDKRLEDIPNSEDYVYFAN